ncbi:MAG: hypothetical protein SH850_09795 [Planctomycetaceae bacterium]|nr:hypothetical protein [Planctomycetaceae bacterium]
MTEIKTFSWLQLLNLHVFLLDGVAPSGIALVLIGCGREVAPPTTGESAAVRANDSNTKAMAGSPKPPAGDSQPGQAENTISPKTTVVTTPVTSDGAIDLVAAINAKDGAGVTPEQNAVLLLYEASPRDFNTAT